MMGSLVVLCGVGVVCASGVVVSSAFRFFHTFEYDLTAKITESKKSETKREMGGVDHAKHIANISKQASNKQ